MEYLNEQQEDCQDSIECVQKTQSIVQQTDQDKANELINNEMAKECMNKMINLDMNADSDLVDDEIDENQIVNEGDEFEDKIKTVFVGVTLENIDSIVNQLSKLINNEEDLKNFVNWLIFKVIAYKNFSRNFRNIFNSLKPLKVVDQNGQSIDFRTVLNQQLMLCFKDHHFEEYLLKNKTITIKNEIKMLRKRSSIMGALCGQLYADDLLDDNVIDFCIDQWLSIANGNTISGVCVFYETAGIGIKLENQMNEKLNQQMFKLVDILKSKDNNMTEVMKNKIVQVLELKKNGWKPIEKIKIQSEQPKISKKKNESIRRPIVLNGDNLFSKNFILAAPPGSLCSIERFRVFNTKCLKVADADSKPSSALVSSIEEKSNEDQTTGSTGEEKQNSKRSRAKKNAKSTNAVGQNFGWKKKIGDSSSSNWRD